MKKAEYTGKKRSILVGFLTVFVLLFGGYFGNSIIDDNSNKEKEETLLDEQKTEETRKESAQEKEEEQKKKTDLEDSSSSDSMIDDTNTIAYEFRSEKLWQQHYEKHGMEMGFDNKEDYLLAANRVIENENVLHKLEEEDGDDVYYLEETNEFVIVSTDGYLRTYFNPKDGIRYFNRQ